jgi:GT2 family glycosyltransferase
MYKRNNFTIVILQYGAFDKITIQLLKYLHSKYRIILVLQGNISKELYKWEEKDVILVRNEKNLGYGGGNNIGIMSALSMGSEYVLILNPDVIIEKTAIEILINTLIKNDQIGIVGPKILSPDSSIWSRGGKIDPIRYSAGLIDYGNSDRYKDRDKKIVDVDFVSGTAIMVRREVFEKIGLFDEQYFLYYEDVDFCLRAKRAGFRVALVSSSRITHYESLIVGKRSSLKKYNMSRSRMLFMSKFAPKKIKFREVIRLPKTVFEYLKEDNLPGLLGMLDYILRIRKRYENRS